MSPSFEGLEKFLDVRFYEELKPLTEAQVEEIWDEVDGGGDGVMGFIAARLWAEHGKGTKAQQETLSRLTEERGTPLHVEIVVKTPHHDVAYAHDMEVIFPCEKTPPGGFYRPITITVGGSINE